MLCIFFKLVQRLSCVPPETCNKINWRWIHQEDQTKREDMNPHSESRFCFLLFRPRPHMQVLAWVFLLMGMGISCMCLRYWFYIKEEDKYFAPVTTVLTLPVPPLMFCLMDGRFCAQDLPSIKQKEGTAGLLAQGFLACSLKLSGHIWTGQKWNARALVVHSPWSGLVPTRLHQNNRCQAVAGELS